MNKKGKDKFPRIYIMNIKSFQLIVTALVPSEIACLASSPGKRSLTADYTDLDERVFLLAYLVRAAASVAS